MRSSTRLVVVASLLVVGLSGCNDSKKPLAATTPTPVPAASVTPAMTALVTALANGTSSEVRAAAAQVAPSSPAAAFLLANAYASVVSEQSPHPADPKATVTPKPGGAFEVCFPVPNASPHCETYGHFLTDSTGAITSWSIENQSIDGRAVLTTGGPETVAGATYQARSMLTRPDGAVIVTVEVKTGSQAITLNAKNAVLVSKDGVTETPDDAIAPAQVKASSTAMFLMLFPPTTLNGQLTLKPCLGSCTNIDPVVLTLT